MAEVLSQNQIDALLNSMQGSEGEESSKSKESIKTNYRKYDFYSPKKFTKDKLKIIKGIYDNYARIVSSQLNGILRMSSEIEVLAVEEQRYYEFSNALSDSDIMMLLEPVLPDESKNPPIITHIHQVLMVNMIDRMLGGLGDDSDVDASYTYTEIELSLYGKIMDYILKTTKDAWSNYIDIELGEQRLEENPSLFQEISLDEPVAIVMLNVKMPEVEGKINICIPGALLTSIFSIIERRKHLADAYDKRADVDKDMILSRIKDSALTVRAELGDAQVSLKDVYNLKVGDVIDLNKPKEADISLYIDQEPWFQGQVGTHNKNVAIRINQRVEDKEKEENKQKELLQDLQNNQEAPTESLEEEVL